MSHDGRVAWVKDMGRQPASPDRAWPLKSPRSEQHIAQAPEGHARFQSATGLRKAMHG